MLIQTRRGQEEEEEEIQRGSSAGSQQPPATAPHRTLGRGNSRTVSSLMYSRDVKLKPTFAINLSYFSFKAMKSGAFNLGCRFRV
jgi:hypothetical protein